MTSRHTAHVRPEVRAYQLCTNPRCRRHGHHGPGCAGDSCRGCVPRVAGEGLRLCLLCVRRLEQDAIAAARLFDELAQALLPVRGVTGSGGGGSGIGAGLTLDDRAVDARAAIRAVLTSWVKLIAEERRISLPLRTLMTVEPRPVGFVGPMRLLGHTVADDSTYAMGAYIARHARWLATHGAAGDAADELATLAHGAARGIAYPEGARRVAISGCPNDGCAGELRAVIRAVDSLLPSAIVCTVDPEHMWTTAQWHRLGRQLQAAA